MKKIAIFGACSAIAQAAARQWAQEGAEFVLIDRNQARLSIVVDDLKSRGSKNIHMIVADLAETDKHADLVKRIREQTEPTVYLFAYGTLSNQPKGQQDFSYAHKELHLNFISAASLLTEITNSLHATRYGSPVTLAVISSVAGDRGRQSNYIYGTAKGALTIWLSGLRNHLAYKKSNIHVLTIKPGFVDTPMTRDFKKGLLWVQPSVVARSIIQAIDTKKDVVYVPWFWRYIMLVIKLIPEQIFKTLGL